MEIRRTEPLHLTVVVLFAFFLGLAAKALSQGADLSDPILSGGWGTVARVAAALVLLWASASLLCYDAAVLDRRTRTVVTYRRFFVRFGSTVRRMDDYDRVEILSANGGALDLGGPLFSLHLAGRQSIDLGLCWFYTRARRRARRIARFAGIGIRDLSSGELIDRPASTLDLPLRDRVAAGGGPPELPPEPLNSRIEWEVQEDEVVFDLPPRGLNWRLLMGVALMLAIAHLAHDLWLRSRGEFERPDGMLLFWLLAFVGGLGFMSLFLAAMRSLACRERVAASHRGVRLERRLGSIRVWSSRIEGELDELVVVPTNREFSRFIVSPNLIVHAADDRKTLEFGLGYSREELQWVRDLIELLVRAPLPRAQSDAAITIPSPASAPPGSTLAP
ncbi:MAG: hypothetical protein HYY93_08245 [Planctomycetes bacterium]|nr:hypothetical protein [Planctomycetota bacterium]